MKWNTKRIAMMGLLIALQIVASKVLSVNLAPTLRLSISDSFILLAGIWFGPLCGMIVGTLSDLVGCIVTGQGILPLLTLGPAVVGLLAGLAGPLLRSSKKILVYGGVIAVISFITSVLIRSWAFSQIYGAPIVTYLGPRSIQACVLIVLNTIVVYKLYHSPVTDMVRGAE